MAISYEEQQKALRATVPKGTAGAAELERQGFTDVGTQPIDVSQPSPKPESLTKVPTQGVGPQGEQIFDVFAGQEHIADPNDPRLKGINIAQLPTGEAPSGFKSKFQQGFEQQKADGAPSVVTDAAQGRTMTNLVGATTAPDKSSVFLQTDPYLGEITKSLQEYMNPTIQRESLLSAYKSMSKELGLEPLNEKLINLDKIMRGTDEAIREQITTAGGTANENQIRGLVNQRNKSFLEEYTTLQQTLASKERYLDTLMGFEQADRQAASEKFDRGLNIAFKLADYQQRGQQFAQSSYQWLVQKTGFDGLYDATGGDPYSIDLIERTMGLSQGGLAVAANQARLAKTQAEQERQLALQEKQMGIQLKQADLEAKPFERVLKQEQIKTEQAQRANIYNQIQERNQKVGDVAIAEKKSIQNQANKANIVLGKVRESEKLLTGETGGFLATGFLQTATGFIGGTPAKNLKTKLDTIKANLSFDTLQAMREASKTGGALGQVSDREIELLGATVASLDPSQSAGQLRSALNDVRTHYVNWLATVGYAVAPNGDIIPIK